MSNEPQHPEDTTFLQVIHDVGKPIHWATRCSPVTRAARQTQEQHDAMKTMTDNLDWPVLTAEDFQLEDHVGERVLPIFEDEAAFGIYGYGHWDKAQFAEVVNEYDHRSHNRQAADPYQVQDVHHVWAVVTDPSTQSFTWRNITADTPFAFPVTLIKR